jgi:hypothetical protein
MSERSFEREETTYNDFLLGYPADGYDQARRRYMDSDPSAETFCSVLGAAAISAERQRVVDEVMDTRLDFDNIINDLD